jgi:hypothetical protein
MTRTVKVGVVGSGLAGLTAAHLLTNVSKASDVEFEVHLFDKVCTFWLNLDVGHLTKKKSSSLGMDSSSVSLPIPGRKEEWRVDVPMRSFQGGM